MLPGHPWACSSGEKGEGARSELGKKTGRILSIWEVRDHRLPPCGHHRRGDTDAGSSTSRITVHGYDQRARVHL
jgi:hypothetical protein